MQETSVPPASLRLTVNRDALAANWRALDAMSGAAATGAAVKADCYGLGVRNCLPALRDAGCEQFFVAHWSEVEAVIEHVPAPQIAVLHGPTRDADVDYAMATGAIPVINSIEQAQRWSARGGGRCHLMIDTGINRLGVSPDELSASAIQSLTVDTLMSHLASADEDSPMNARQRDAFRGCLPMVRHNRTSLANSAGIALGPDYAFDQTRPGLALYGGIPRSELEGVISQVAFIEAAIIQTRAIDRGGSVGYNCTFTAERAMCVATVSIGYADGFLRVRGPSGVLRHDGRELPILGKVSMDMIVVDLANAPDLHEGDWLEVPFNLPDVARQSSVSQYELLTTIGHRLRA